jgi:putative glycosyltransferase (TIGR04372 family)
VGGLLDRIPPHIRFTADEERIGAEALRAMGIPKGAPFVCFHSRDAAYEERIYPDKRVRYVYRNSPIEDYLEAARALTRTGLYAVRLGAEVDRALPAADPRIVDYATRYRTPFLDLYLSAYCLFFVGSGTGMNAIPMIFRRPVVLVNFIPLEFAPTWSAHDLFIPKLLWLRAEQRYLSFREILESGLGRSLRERYDERGIDVVDNTAEDITAVSLEMEERLRGTWQGASEDEKLQRRFWELWRPSDLNGVFRSRIGAAFLRRHASLLD